MARPIYPYEMGDPDFSWLITNFTENNPNYSAVEDSCLPVIFLPLETCNEEFVPGLPYVSETPDAEECPAEDGEV